MERKSAVIAVNGLLSSVTVNSMFGARNAKKKLGFQKSIWIHLRKTIELPFSKKGNTPLLVHN
ncbi:MAG: hypothetical protein J5725_11990 [Bacteroidales bacterium]|nr:hypothetical protein [Bacteroidales bacterium]